MRAHSHRETETEAGLGLVEVLVALLVLSLGLLAALRLQAWLRTNGDIAHERAEAVHQAQQSLERLRDFDDLPAFDRPPPEPESIDAPTTRYEPRRQLVDANGLRTGHARVNWLHRDGDEYTEQLVTGVARLSPVYSAALDLPSQGTAFAARQALPPGAGVLQDGRGIVRPTRNSTLAWVVGANGEITRQCRIAPGVDLRTVRESDLLRCEDFSARLVLGHVRFALGAVADPVVANDAPLAATIVAGDTRCDTEPFVAGSERALAYACAVPRSPDSPPPRLVPQGWTIGTAPGSYKVCRYPHAADGAPLNLLVLRGELPCPPLPSHNGGPATTVQHQP